MDGYPYSYTEFRTHKVHTCTDLSTKRWTFTLSKFDEPFSVRFHFWKIFWELTSVSVKVILLVWHDKTLHSGYKRINEKMDYHILSKIWRAFRRSVPFWQIFFFLGNRVGRCEDHTFGWGRQDYVHNGYMCVNEKIDSHITEILTSLSAFGSILKFFWRNRRR